MKKTHLKCVSKPVELPLSEIKRYGRFIVVDDGTLPGGTKQRYLGALLNEFPGVKEWVYASPTYGYAQIALACACKDFNKKAVIFIPERKELYEYSKIAKQHGADMRKVPMGFLKNCQGKASKYVGEHKGAALVPFGCDHEVVLANIAQYARSLVMRRPTEVWTAISSGTLSRGLQRAWPNAKFYGVQTGHKVTDYERGRAEIIVAPEKYERPAKNPPPFASCQNYDAKVWAIMNEHGADNALFWNVAK